jgi:hypothetical protein
MIMSVIRFKNNTLYASEFITQPGINKVRFTHDGKVICNGYITQDLRMPADATFTRPTPAYLSDGTQVAANAPRFEQGKFGKAVMVEEGTTNLVVNGSIENNLSYWYATNDISAGDNGVVRRIVGDAAVGNACLEYEITNHPSWGFFHNDYNQYRTSPYFDTSKQYTISFWAKRILGSNIMHVKISDANGRNVVWSGGSFTLYDTWTRYTFTFTPAIAGNQPVVFFNYYIAGQTGKCRIDGLQIEQQRYATSFIDGTRSAESLTIPTAGVLNPQEGTVECWAYVDPYIHKQGSDWNMIFVVTDSNEANQLRFGYSRSSGKWHVKTTNSAGTAWYADFTVSSGWHHFALTWNQSTTTAKMYVDGIIVAQETSAPLPSAFASTARIGSWLGSMNVFNSLIDDLRISSRARSDAEILAAYQSGQPAPVDEWTTYKADFDEKIRFTHDGKVVCEKFALV